jgi:hypothetical protein
MSENTSPLALELDSIRRQLEGMSKEELIDRLALYEFVIPKLGPWVKWFIDNMYQIVVARWRMNRQVIGYLIGATLIPETIDILAEEEIRDYERKKIVYEQRVVHAPWKELIYVDVVLGKTREEDWNI